MQPTLSIAADVPACAPGTVTFTVTRSGDASGPTTVDYRASTGGTGRVWFGGGETAKKIWLDVPAPGAVSVKLTSANGAKIANASASCTVGGAPPAPQPAPPPPAPPAPAPAPTAPTSDPTAGLVLAFQPDLTKPLDLYHPTDNPAGLWKPNAPWDKDGEVKCYMEGWSRWPDHPLSRKAHLDLQTFVDPRYNGMNPFSVGADGTTITASSNPSPSDKAPDAYVSGLLSTQPSFAQRYGYIECDVTRPSVKGTWPAFWLLPVFPDEGSNELDVFEGLGGRIGAAYHNAHIRAHARPAFDIPCGEATGLEPRITAGLLWTPDALRFFVNRRETHAAPNPGFHKPMFLIASMAVGPMPGAGGWSDINTPVDEAGFPARCTFHRISAWRLP